MAKGVPGQGQTPPGRRLNLILCRRHGVVPEEVLYSAEEEENISMYTEEVQEELRHHHEQCYDVS
jgi:hypothetical protein